MPPKRANGRAGKSSPKSRAPARARAQPSTAMNGTAQVPNGNASSSAPRAQREVVDLEQTGSAPSGLSRGNELEEHLDCCSDSWETDSLFADIIDDITTENIPDDVDAVTPREAIMFRQQLHDVGPNEFCRLYVDSKVIPIRKLLTAFSVRTPEFLDGRPDEACLGLLTLAMARELAKRSKISSYNTVDDAVGLIKKAKNIMVLTGAGISTSLGIPDFRSKETGLYAKLAQLDLGVDDPQEVFNIQVFNEDPSIFYTVAKEILPSTKTFSPTHAFIALLQQQGKLLTNYSQNIDNLEANAGISPDKVIQCHGSFATASCQRCRHQVVGTDIYDDIMAGRVPRCLKCISVYKAKTASHKRKRTSEEPAAKRARTSDGAAVKRVQRKTAAKKEEEKDELEDPYDIPQVGVMKPDITFFGEELPGEFSKRLVKHDRNKVDLVIVIGTSLKVAPVSEVVRFLPQYVPQIYISRTPVSHINFDIDLLGDCDVVVAELCRRAGWDLRHPMVPAGENVEITLEDGYRSRYIFKSVKQQEPVVNGGQNQNGAPNGRNGVPVGGGSSR